MKKLSIQEIMQLDPEKVQRLSKTEIRELTQIMVSAANKRVKRLRETGVPSPALSGAMHGKYAKAERLFSTKGKNINQLRAEFSRVARFLSASTSTVTGARKFEKDYYRDVFGVRSSDLSTEEKRQLWDLVHRITQLPQFMKGTPDYQKGLKMVALVYKKHGSRNFDQMLEDLMNKVDNLYQLREENANNVIPENPFDAGSYRPS